MAIITSKSIAVEILDEEHKALKEIVKKILDVVDNIRLSDFEQPLRGDIHTLFDYFHRRLSFHFHTEEDLGLLKDIADDIPRYRARVDILFSDHKALLEELESIIDNYFKQNPCASDSELKEFSQTVTDFFNKFKDHESRETSFILEADNTDLGSHD